MFYTLTKLNKNIINHKNNIFFIKNIFFYFCIKFQRKNNKISEILKEKINILHENSESEKY